MTILSYWELSEEDRPPEEYWGDDDALEEWFKAVKARHGTPGSGSEPLEDVPQTGNEYVKEFLGG